MHLLIPFASALSEAAHEALAPLQLPALGQLLGRWRETGRDEGDEQQLSPPHERAQAAALGWSAADGLLPFAALQAAAAGLPAEGRAWGRLTPAHWHVGTEGIDMVDPAALQLSEFDSRALLDAVRELFESEGFELAWQAPDRWLASHASLAELPTASLDRVIGRGIDAWLPDRSTGRLVRRLQNEAQMLWHRHPLNESREDAGALPVNSFWLSACGRWQPAQPAGDLQIDERLRAPALAGDWAAWQAGWRALDSGPVARLLAEGGRLTLCGERSAVTYAPAEGGWWQRLTGRRGPAAAALLGGL